ncbi:MAG: hypothetical protein AVDCRST_MAG43-676, partial [uncultured Thermomicrobiales bacterium]
GRSDPDPRRPWPGRLRCGRAALWCRFTADRGPAPTMAV